MRAVAQTPEDDGRVYKQNRSSFHSARRAAQHTGPWGPGRDETYDGRVRVNAEQVVAVKSL